MKVLLVRSYPSLPTSRWLQSMICLEPYAQELVAAAVVPPQDVRICDLAAIAKRMPPGAITLIGGIHAFCWHSNRKREELFDLAVRGDGVWHLLRMYRDYDRTY